MTRDTPADASGAYRPGPPAKTESLPGLVPPIFLSLPLVTEGLPGNRFFPCIPTPGVIAFFHLTAKKIHGEHG